MLRFFTVTLTLVLGLALTSCFDILEEIELNKDGSGVYKMTMDMGEMLSSPFMRMALEEQMKENGELDASEMKMDSVINYLESPNAGELTAAERAVIAKLDARMSMDMEAGEGGFFMVLPFDNVEEINILQEGLEKLDEEDGEEAAEDGGNPFAGMFGGGGMQPSDSRFRLQKRTLIREVTVGELPFDDMEDESLDMVKMMFEGATMTTIYRLPGKVKSTTIEGAEVDGKTVTVSYDLVELFEGQIPDTGGEIKFKKR
jgi:hypothetical protein